MTERDLTLLEIVAEAGEPVGSWYIVDKFEESGVSLSSATIGRMLNQLEKKGFLEKHGIKGRTITEKGVDAISTIRKSMKLEEHKKNLDDLINSDVLHKFLMVLEARQAIERTTAKLAAERITDDEIQALERIIHKQQQDYVEHNSIAQDDIDFHRTIALASRNEALYSLYMMLSLMGQQSELFEELRKRVHRHYMGSHRAIFDALKQRNPEKAEKSMAGHLEQLCKDVNTYWHDFQENRKITI